MAAIPSRSKSHLNLPTWPCSLLTFPNLFTHPLHARSFLLLPYQVPRQLPFPATRLPRLALPTPHMPNQSHARSPGALTTKGSQRDPVLPTMRTLMIKALVESRSIQTRDSAFMAKLLTILWVSTPILLSFKVNLPPWHFWNNHNPLYHVHILSKGKTWPKENA